MKNVINCIKIILIPVMFIISQFVGVIVSMCLYGGELYKENGTLETLSMLISAFIMFIFIYMFGVKNINTFDADIKRKIRGDRFLIITLAITVIMSILTQLFVSRFYTSDLIHSSYNNINIFILLLIIIIFAPVYEEFMFRYLTYNLCYETTKNKPAAVLIQAFIFGCMHGKSVQFIYSFIMGVFFGLILMKTNNIKVCCLNHIVFNIVNLIPFVLLYKYNLILYISIIFLIMCLLFLVHLFIKEYKNTDSRNIYG